MFFFGGGQAGRCEGGMNKGTGPLFFGGGGGCIPNFHEGTHPGNDILTTANSTTKTAGMEPR